MIKCVHCGEVVEMIAHEPDKNGNYDPHLTGECIADKDICMRCGYIVDNCQCDI